jgi:hypothetical protein
VAKEWGPFQSWVEQVGTDGVAALHNLQAGLAKRGKALLPFHLRALHGLLTPDARLSVLPAMAAEGAGLDDVAVAAAEAVQEQWVEFVWRPQNPKLHPDTGVPCNR